MIKKKDKKPYTSVELKIMDDIIDKHVENRQRWIGNRQRQVKELRKLRGLMAAAKTRDEFMFICNQIDKYK